MLYIYLFFKEMTELNHAARLAASLLQIKAIRLSPRQTYTWASGLLSPVYCDNRLLLSYPSQRSEAIDGLVGLAAEFGPLDGIAGVATAGIPHGALLADRLGLPFLYVRSKPKEHGKGNQIEGEVNPGSRLLVIEDLISTGGSSLQAVQALRDAGMQPVAVLALFTYAMSEASRRFQEAGIPLRTVTSFPEVIRIARESGAISLEEFGMLEEWYQDPPGWSAARKEE